MWKSPTAPRGTKNDQVDTFLSSPIDTLQDVMRGCKQKLRKRALLRNLSTLSPVLNNETRWSITYHMIERFNDIREARIEVADSDDAEVFINRRVSSKNKTVKYSKNLGEINMVTLALQKKGCNLSDCR